MSDNNKSELIIIGAGPGGYRAAFMAADLGLDVTVIDPEINPGGVCLYRGCIPTKALLHLTKIMRDATTAGEMGINFSDPDVDMGKVRKWKSDVVKKLTGGLGQLIKSRKINYIQGIARFTEPGKISIETKKSGEKEISYQNIIIATGTKPLSLPDIDLSDPLVMNSDDSLELKDMQGEMLIIGGGYIGLEMATIYHTFNTEVSIVELTDDFMPGMDKDLIATYKKEGKKYLKIFF